MQAKATRTPKIFARMAKKISGGSRQISAASISYSYNYYSIELPATHLLPQYQSKHPKYDRFLPHLVQYVDQSDTIVDIGANVGDTLAALVERNPSASYICIEPDDLFYRFLEKNVRSIKSSFEGLKVETVKALVGKNVSNVSLEGTGGTKHAVLDGSGPIKSIPLDEILATAVNIRIIKSDVDVLITTFLIHRCLLSINISRSFISNANPITNTRRLVIGK